MHRGVAWGGGVGNGGSRVLGCTMPLRPEGCEGDWEGEMQLCGLMWSKGLLWGGVVVGVEG